MGAKQTKPLKYFRKKCCLTLPDLAQLSGVHQGRLSLAEKDKITLKTEELIAVSSILEVSVEQLT